MAYFNKRYVPDWAMKNGKPRFLQPNDPGYGTTLNRINSPMDIYGTPSGYATPYKPKPVAADAPANIVDIILNRNKGPQALYYPAPTQQPATTLASNSAAPTGGQKRTSTISPSGKMMSAYDKERLFNKSRQEELGLQRSQAASRDYINSRGQRDQAYSDMSREFYNKYGFHNSGGVYFAGAGGTGLNRRPGALSFQELQDALSSNPSRFIMDKINRRDPNARERDRRASQQQQNLQWAASLGIDVPQALANDPTSQYFIKYVQNQRDQMARQRGLSDLEQQVQERELRKQLSDSSQFVNQALAQAIKDIQSKYAQLGRYGSPEMYSEIQQVQQQASLAAAGQQYSNPYDFGAR